jgi:hypothetical protein
MSTLAEVIIPPEEQENKREVSTICKVCVFATRDADGKQLDCSLGNLDKFRALGVKVEEENNYFKIHDTICQWARTPDWEHAGDEFRALHANLELQERSKLDVVIDYDHEHNISQLETTLESLKNQTVKPYRVIVTTNDLRPRVIVSVVNFVKKTMAGSEIKWSVERGIQEQDKNHRVARAMRKCSKMYFAFFDTGYSVHPDFLRDVSVYLNHKLEKFSLILPLEEGSDNGTVIQTGLYAMVGGSSQFIDVVQEMAKNQNRSHMIKLPSEVFPWVKK